MTRVGARIELDSRVKAARDQVSADLQGEVAILYLVNGVYYGLEEVGARIWELIQEPRTVAEIRDSIVAEYDVLSAVAERDLLRLLQRLRAERLLEVVA